MTEQDLLYQAEKVQASVPDSEPLLSRFRRRQQKQRQELLLIIAVVTVLLGACCGTPSFIPALPTTP